MEKDLQVVGFRIGNETFGVRIGSVREIVRVPEITAVPSAAQDYRRSDHPRRMITPSIVSASAGHRGNLRNTDDLAHRADAHAERFVSDAKADDLEVFSIATFR